MIKYIGDLEKLKDFGFRDNGLGCYSLDPNYYKDGHPLKGMFTVENVFIKKDTGEFWCGFVNDETKKAFDALNTAGLLQEVIK